MSDWKDKLEKWGGSLIVAGVFVGLILMNSLFGDLGLGDYGSLIYILPTMGGLLYWLVTSFNKKPKTK